MTHKVSLMIVGEPGTKSWDVPGDREAAERWAMNHILSLLEDLYQTPIPKGHYWHKQSGHLLDQIVRGWWPGVSSMAHKDFGWTFLITEVPGLPATNPTWSEIVSRASKMLREVTEKM